MHLAVDRLAAGGLARPGDPEAPGRPCDLGEIRTLLGGHGIGRTRLGPTGDIEHRRAVADAARDDVVDAEAHCVIEPVGKVGVAVAGRLHANQAAARRRDANRTQAVAGVSQRDVACRHRGRRAARRPPGHMLGVPWIAHGAIGGGLDIADNPEFRTGAAADGDHAAFPIAPHQAGIDAVDDIAAEPAARRIRPTGDPDAEILDDERYPSERALRHADARHLARFVESPIDDCVDRAIEPLDSRDSGINQFKRGYLTLAYELREAEPILGGVFLRIYHHTISNIRAPYPAISPWLPDKAVDRRFTVSRNIHSLRAELRSSVTDMYPRRLVSDQSKAGFAATRSW